MVAVLSIGETSYIPLKKLGVVLNSKESECLYQKKYSHLKNYFKFHPSWESLKKDQVIYKDLFLTVGRTSNPYFNEHMTLILSIIKDKNFPVLRRKTDETTIKVTPILTNNVCSTLEDIKEVFLMPGLINLTLDELKVLGDSDYIFTYRGISENSLLDSAKMLRSVIESSFLLDNQLDNFKLKSLLIHVLGKEDLNIENVYETFSFTLELLNTLIKVNGENIEKYFGVSVRNIKENKIILFLGLKNKISV